MKTVIAVTALCAVGCAWGGPIYLSTAERELLTKLAGQPTTIVVSDADATQAWQRAQVWVAKHSTMLIQQMNDVIIQTFEPVGTDVKYGYSVTRLKTDAGWEISVRCVYSNSYTAAEAKRNERILAHYIATAEYEPRLVNMCSDAGLSPDCDQRVKTRVE